MKNGTIVSEYINFSKQCLNCYFQKILVQHYEQEIVKALINDYIDARYYFTSSNLPLNIRQALNKAKLKYKGQDALKAEKIVQTFNFIMYFDNVIEAESTVKIVEAISAFRQMVLGIEKEKDFNEELLNMVREDLIKKKDFLEGYSNDKFKFDTLLTTQARVYDVVLNQNLNFPNVYSPRVIDKLFNSKNIIEKRALVEYNYTALAVLKDIIQGNLAEYLVVYPENISETEEELKRLFGLLDHSILKRRVCIKIKFEEFLNEKNKIFNLMKDGYRFAVYLENSFVEDETNLNYLRVFKYIIINRRNSFVEINDYKNVIKVE